MKTSRMSPWLGVMLASAASCSQPADVPTTTPDADASADASDAPDVEAPPADPCALTVSSCPPGEVVVESTSSAGVLRSVCVPAFADCGDGEVEDETGACVALSPPCALGALDDAGSCRRTVPECAAGTTAVADQCVDLEPDLGCPAGDFPDAEPGEAPRYVLAGADASGADGTLAHPFPTIGEGLAGAKAGTAVLVGAGAYAPFSVGVSGVRVRGLCAAKTNVVSATAGTSSVLVNGKSATNPVKDVTVERLGVSGKGVGIAIQKAQGIHVGAIRSQASTGVGIQVLSATQVTLEDLEVADTIAEKVTGGVHQNGVVMANGASEVTLTRAVLSIPGSGAAVQMVNVGTVDIEAVRTTGAITGVSVVGPKAQATLTSCLLGPHAEASLVVGPPDAPGDVSVRLEASEISGDGSQSSSGIGLVAPGASLELVQSSIHDTGIGLYADQGRRIVVSGSRLDDNVISDIQVHDGGATEALLVTDTAFRAPDQAIVSLAPSTPAIALKGCRFESTKGSTGGRDGEGPLLSAVLLRGGLSTVVEGNVFHEVAGIGVTLDGPRAARVVGNLLVACGGEALLADTAPDLGEVVAPDVVMERNHVRGGVGPGILVRDLRPVHVLRNLVTDIVPIEGSSYPVAIYVGAPADATGTATVERNVVLRGDAEGMILVSGTLEVRDNLVLGARRFGIDIEAADAVLEGNVVAFLRRGTLVGSDGIGHEVAYSAVFELGSHGLVSANRLLRGDDIGLFVAGGSDATINQNLVLGHSASGITIQEATSTVTATSNEVACNTGAGIRIVTSSASLAKNRVHDTALDALETFGDGVAISPGSDVTMDEDVVERSGRYGVYVPGLDGGLPISEQPVATLATSGILVREAARSGIDLGRGVSASVTASRIELCHGVGLVVRGAMVTLKGTVVTGTQPFGSQKRFGDGIEVLPDGRLTADGVDVTGNARAGVLVHGGTGVMTGGTVTGNAYGIVRQSGGSLSVDAKLVFGNLVQDVLDALPDGELPPDSSN